MKSWAQEAPRTQPNTTQCCRCMWSVHLDEPQVHSLGIAIKPLLGTNKGNRHMPQADTCVNSDVSHMLAMPENVNMEHTNDARMAVRIDENAPTY